MTEDGTPAIRRSEDAAYLHGAIQDLRERMRASEQDRRDIAVRLKTLESASVNADNVVWSGRALIGAISISAAIVGGSYLANGGARGEMHDIKMLIEERTKAQDKTNAEMRGAIDSLQRDIKATEERLRAEIRMKEYARNNGLKQP
jgi:hypothetical protein